MLATQAIVATGMANEWAPMLRKAHDFIDKSQVPVCWIAMNAAVF